jgi:hypothetical protein
VAHNLSASTQITQTTQTAKRSISTPRNTRNI